MLGNKKYKDSVFTLLFKDKKKLIELFNAIEGTAYSEDTKLELNTLENTLYMDRKNDVSFLLDDRFIILIEHQSTINENMPLRMLIYISRVYEKIIDNKAIYQENLIKIPTPEFFVLYNGDKNYPEEISLKLSDAFLAKEKEPMLDLTVKVININYDKSAKVLAKSKTLNDYSYFVHRVKTYRKQGEALEDAIRKSVIECTNQGILGDFLKANGTEVFNMLFTEFNLEDAKKVWQEEAAEKAAAKATKEATEKAAKAIKEAEDKAAREAEKAAREAEKATKAEENTKQRIAFQLIDVLDIETISRKTGLSIQEIEKLRNQS